MKPILIDAVAETISQIELNITAREYSLNEEIHRVLGCQTFCEAHLPDHRNHVIVLDDVGLFNAKRLFVINACPQPLPNKALIFGLKGPHYRNPTWTVEDVAKQVRWVDPRDTESVVAQILSMISVVAF